MSANPQWDVSRALGVARLFQLVCGVRDGSVSPFLTLYLRQLGLAAPWVGVLMGTKHLIAAFWAPFCALLAQNHQKRRALLTGSLLGSVGASLLLVLVPPLHTEPGSGPCNGSVRVPATAPPPGVWAATTNATWALESASSPPAGAPGLARNWTPDPDGPGRSDRDSVGHIHGGYLARTTSHGLLPPAASDEDVNTWEGAYEVVNTALALLPAEGPGLASPANWSTTEGHAKALDLSLEGLRWTFILSLGSVVLWELLTAPLEQVADDSLYEYLDFVDATDRYGSLWVWRLLGVSAGACGTAALVEQLGCFLVSSGPQGALHFYGYSVVSFVALLVSIAFPVPKCLRQEPRYRTIKALSVMGGAPRLILLALTVFLIGAVTSTVQNFLFWHMRDHGSGELVMGFSLALGLLGELSLRPFKTVLLSKVSRVGMVGLGLGCLAGQLLYYSFIWSWWSVLPVQALSAISGGALWWAVVASIEDLATSGTERPLTAMFRGHLYGGGCSLGSFVGGFVVMHFGLAVLYQACCVALLLWLALFLAIQPRLPQERKINYSKLLAVEASDTSDSEPGLDQDWFVKAVEEEQSHQKG